LYSRQTPHTNPRIKFPFVIIMFAWCLWTAVPRVGMKEPRLDYYYGATSESIDAYTHLQRLTSDQSQFVRHATAPHILQDWLFRLQLQANARSGSAVALPNGLVLFRLHNQWTWHVDMAMRADPAHLTLVTCLTNAHSGYDATIADPTRAHAQPYKTPCLVVLEDSAPLCVLVSTRSVHMNHRTITVRHEHMYTHAPLDAFDVRCAYCVFNSGL